MFSLQKRLFDLVFSTCVLLGTLPLFLVIALLIKATSKGPIFFRGLRVGKGGKLFTCYKFRTMHVDAKDRLEWLLAENPKLKREWRVYQKLKRDPRITKLGKWLRLFSLDEFPQFWNVLLGDLSIVGPRPVEIYHPEHLLEEIQGRFQKRAEKILSVKPGITCLWQVCGRNLLPTKKQVELEEQYINQRSFLLDLKIICKTVYIVIFPKGAY